MSQDLPTLYECREIVERIEQMAEANEGELTDEQIADLVHAETSSIVRLGKLCGYLRFLDTYIENGTSEIDRIKKLLDRARNRQASVKKWLTPYVDEQRQKLGRPLDCGVNRLSTKHTQAVVITDPESFKAGAFPAESRTKTVHEPDKAKIKEFIEKHGSHPGAVVQENVSLIIT